MEIERAINIEFKARCTDLDTPRRILEQMDAEYAGRDHQIDTYFRCERGRLKLREGAIENALIYYRRADEADLKRSDIELHRTVEGASLKAVLSGAYGVDVIVEKYRDIYYVDNVKIHLDDVPGLGCFLEVEAIDYDGRRDPNELHRQCEHFRRALRVEHDALVATSYADLINERRDERLSPQD